MPTVDALLRAARETLQHVETPALDARLLFQHVTGFSHADVMARHDEEVALAAVTQFEALVARRAQHEPVSRILGQREFYGRSFQVTPDVLDPRADTEVLVTAVLQRVPEGKPVRVLDLGTGSGAIILTLLAERPMAEGVAVDVSKAALDVTIANAERLGVGGRLQAVQSAWFERVAGVFDVVVSNPPYIEADVIPTLSRDVRDFDPHLALDGGADGLDCYRAIAHGVGAHLAPEGFIAVEIGAGQDGQVASIFNQSGFSLGDTHKDLGGHGRCLFFNPQRKSL
jgi:release factor glutamine methyltransferase